eukprot:6196513-Pleurochrysis_carterae.AAC.3
MRMMQENVSLIKEINELRREIKGMKMAQRAKDMAGGSVRMLKSTSNLGSDGDISMQTSEVQRLRQRIEQLESGSTMMGKSASREVLPHMEGMLNSIDPKK